MPTGSVAETPEPVDDGTLVGPDPDDPGREGACSPTTARTTNATATAASATIAVLLRGTASVCGLEVTGPTARAPGGRTDRARRRSRTGRGSTRRPPFPAGCTAPRPRRAPAPRPAAGAAPPGRPGPQ